MEHLVEATNLNVSKFLYSLMPSMIEQLGLTRSRRAVLIKVTDEIEAGMQGATLNIEIADCYLVLIRQPKRITKASLLEMGTTLAKHRAVADSAPRAINPNIFIASSL